MGFRSRVNLLGYLCSAAVARGDVATRLINSRLLAVLTHQLQQAPSWDVRSKVLRVIGLLAQHCTILSEETPTSEVVCAITDLLRDNLRNNKAKQCLLPPLGELLYRIASQVGIMSKHRNGLPLARNAL
ncbi:serine/threonine-protein kinase ULK4-like [Gadus chalcogrammus]|uniref:serine/threonine-protein kinase ULK4-like n=1 Tax=Gadus chalcogrammus TaxID=1042646 RepID=UPI0024C3E701|nr:serine/threonine-protein kinase ULK4-like [Gadus chalcogrammus]